MHSSVTGNAGADYLHKRYGIHIFGRFPTGVMRCFSGRSSNRR